MNFSRYIVLALKGCAMGMADVVPGVSGGTIAFISGIYEELLDSIRSVNATALKLLLKLRLGEFWRHINGSFLLPVLLMLLEAAGLVTREKLKKGRRYAIVIAFVVAAVLTPPDVVSQLLLAIPLVLLYEISLVAIWFTERKRARIAAAEAKPS